MDNAIIILLKNAHPGQVKTRLAKTAGDEQTLLIYKALLEHVRRSVLDVSAMRYAYYSDFPATEDKWSSRDFINKKQRGKNVGERMAKAFSEVLPLHKKVLLIGSDLPSISSAIIEDAFAHLDHSDVVIGPAIDGGYYLIGMKEFYPSFFQNIAWSTSQVFEKTVRIIELLGKSWSKLPELPDIDTEEDWERYGWKL